MARTTQTESEIAALSRRLDASRARVGHHVLEVREKFNLPRRLKQSMRGKPAPWIGAALAIGLLLARPFKRRSTSQTVAKPATKLALVTTLFALLKPFLRSIVLNEVKRRLGARLTASRLRTAPPET